VGKNLGPGVRFLPSLLKFWAKEGFDPSGKTLLLAVSGGCDSVAMLELFSREIVPRFKCRLQAIHINHRLRPTAGIDQALVEKLCHERKVPLHIESLNPAVRAAGQSVEMWGREHRYAAFAKTRKAVKADFVLTAHHRDDVVETLCLRLWRGTGLAGLAGIPFQRESDIVRPLLPVSRQKLKTWILSLGIGWAEDETNRDLNIPRNWVRHHLLPLWRKSEPKLDHQIFQIARRVSQLIPAWNRWNEKSFPESEVRNKGGIPAEWLQNGADAEVLRNLLSILGLDKPGPEALTEIIRQGSRSGARLRVRLNPTTVLAEKHGLLSISHGFKP